MQQLSVIVQQILSHIQVYLDELTDDAYQAPLPLLSDASIGGHTRHVIDGFLCLMRQQASGTICYDQRERDIRIEKEVNFTKQKLNEINAFLEGLRENNQFIFETNYHQKKITTTSSLERELIHNIEHVIHHLAIVKIALLHYHPHIAIPKTFGVAPSTLQYWKEVEVVPVKN